MQVTLSTGRKFNIEALTVVQSLEAVRLTRSIPQAEPGGMNTMAYLVQSQRDIINWALGNAGADPDIADRITGTLRLDEMAEMLSHIKALTLLSQGVSSKAIN